MVGLVLAPVSGEVACFSPQEQAVEQNAAQAKAI